jgi:integrase
MAKLTYKDLKAIGTGQIGEKIRDEENLSGRIRSKSSGVISVSFTYRYRWGDKIREIGCGTWSSDDSGDSLAEIRKSRDDAKAKIQKGIDPAVERKTVALQTKIQQTQQVVALEDHLSRSLVSGLFEKWCNAELKSRKTEGKETIRAFGKDVLPVIGHFRAEDVTKAHVMEILDAVIARGANRMAKVLLSDMRQMFGYALDREIVIADPTARIKKDKIGGKEVFRTRTLSDDEIKDLADKLPSAAFTHTTECAIWIMLSTCCRVGEISRARWQDVDTEAGTWQIPAEHSKNKRAHTIYLSDFARAQFERLAQYKDHDVWIYADRSKTTHVCTKSISKQVGDRQRETPLQGRSQAAQTLNLSGGHFTPHDLRRTAATMMGRLRVSPEVIEKCLNHTEESKLKKTYQHQELKEEQRQAWQLLGDRLGLILKPADNVVMLRAV